MKTEPDYLEYSILLAFCCTYHAAPKILKETTTMAAIVKNFFIKYVLWLKINQN